MKPLWLIAEWLFPQLSGLQHSQITLTKIIDYQRRWLVVSMLGHLFQLILMVMIMIIVPQETKFFAVTTDGKLHQLTNDHNADENSAIAFARMIARTIMNTSFLDVEEGLLAQKPFFTASGWKGYLHALSEARLLEDLKKFRLMVRAVQTSVPIIEQKTQDGRLRLRVDMDLRVIGPQHDKHQDVRLQIGLEPRPGHNSFGYLVTYFIVTGTFI